MGLTSKGSFKRLPNSHLHFDPFSPLSEGLEACAYKVKVLIVPNLSKIQVSSISDPGSFKNTKNYEKLSLTL